MGQNNSDKTQNKITTINYMTFLIININYFIEIK